jgi:hypothetical protein
VSSNKLIIKQGDQASKAWRTGARPAHKSRSPTGDDMEIPSLHGDVGVAASGAGEHAGKVGGYGGEEGSDGGGLVGGLSKDGGEPAACEVDGAFGVDADGTTHRGDEGTGSGEDGNKLWYLLGNSGRMRTTDTYSIRSALVERIVVSPYSSISRGEHDRDAASTEGHISIADLTVSKFSIKDVAS